MKLYDRSCACSLVMLRWAARLEVGIGAFALCSSVAIATAHAAEVPLPSVVPLFTKGLADLPGREALMITVEFPPGGADPLHRHDAHGFIYVLEGSIVMQVAGGPEVTLGPGQTFYEGPADIHTIGRNASNTEPAKLLVVLIKNVGVAPVLPVR